MGAQNWLFLNIKPKTEFLGYFLHHGSGGAQSGKFGFFLATLEIFSRRLLDMDRAETCTHPVSFIDKGGT